MCLRYLVIQCESCNTNYSSMSREQTNTFRNLLQGSVRTLFTEKTDVWINVHNMLKPLKNGRFLWASERSGFRHLYIWEDAKGVGKLSPVTDGDWQVEDVVAVDEDKSRFLFKLRFLSP